MPKFLIQDAGQDKNAVLKQITICTPFASIIYDITRRTDWRLNPNAEESGNQEMALECMF